jgi:hypothetical protein
VGSPEESAYSLQNEPLRDRQEGARYPSASPGDVRPKPGHDLALSAVFMRRRSRKWRKLER